MAERPGLRRLDGLGPELRRALEPLADVLSRITGVGDTDAITALAGRLACDKAWRVVGSTGQPAYQAAWAGTASFAKHGDGIVRLRGRITSPGPIVLPQTAFILPAGYRPAVATGFAAADALGGSAYFFVNATGEVVVAASGSITDVCVDQIVFAPADQAPDELLSVITSTRSKVNEIISRLQED